MRAKLGYTQQQVADLLGIDRSTYAYYETGKIKPDIKTVMNLAKAFGVNYTEILESEKEGRFSDAASAGSNKTNGKTSGEKISLSNINNLTKKEQDVVMLFRMLSGKSQDEVLESLIETFKKG